MLGDKAKKDPDPLGYFSESGNDKTCCCVWFTIKILAV
jgi:hypothetical protein